MVSFATLKTAFVSDVRRPFTWVVTAVVILLLFIDFFNRIYTPVAGSDSDLGENETVSVQSITEHDFYSLSSLQWRHSFVQDAAQDLQPEVIVPEIEVLTELMTDSEELGDYLVRVRAVFTSSTTGRRVALAELQEIHDRKIAFEHLAQGDKIGEFEVTSINGQHVLFTHPEGAEVLVSVFDWHPDLEAEIPINDKDGERKQREEFDEVF